MKSYSVTLVYLIILPFVHESQQQYYISPVVTVPVLRYGYQNPPFYWGGVGSVNREIPVKWDGVQKIEQVQTKDNDCGSHDEEDQQVAESFKKLMLLGDSDLLLSQSDDHQDEHCNDARKHLKSLVDHVKCIEGEFGIQMSLLANGFKKWVRDRCYSKEWHDRFIVASQCYSHRHVQDEWHSCHDKNIASLSYVLNNIPTQLQIDAMCCFIPLTKHCQHNQTDIYCGRDVADKSAALIWEPWNERIDTWCDGKLDCSQYPSMHESLKQIWNSEAPVTNRDNFYKLFFKVIKNAFNEEGGKQQYEGFSQQRINTY